MLQQQIMEYKNTNKKKAKQTRKLKWKFIDSMEKSIENTGKKKLNEMSSIVPRQLRNRIIKAQLKLFIELTCVFVCRLIRFLRS